MNNFEILGLLLLMIFAVLSGAAAFGFIRMVEQVRRASGWRTALCGAGLWLVISSFIVVVIRILPTSNRGAWGDWNANLVYEIAIFIGPLGIGGAILGSVAYTIFNKRK